MAVTEFQSRILQLLVGSRIKHGESYIVRDLFRGSDEDLLAALVAGTIRFHEGRISGAWPTVSG